VNPAVAALAAFAATRGAWLVADWAARRRGITLGTLPAVAGPAAAGTAALAAGNAAFGAPAIAVLAATLVAAVTDARCGAIFDALTIALALAAGGAALAAGALPTAASGAAAAGGALGLLYVATARRGIGLGDVKLAVGIGAGLGAPAALGALGAAFVLGGAAGVWFLASGRARPGSRVRFGPFLAAGAYAAVLTGPLVR